MKRQMCLAFSSLFLVLQACATAHVRVAREPSSLGVRFVRAAIPPFINRSGSELPLGATENVAGAVMSKLRKEYPSAFREVESPATSQPGELVVKGAITGYDSGSKALRFILIGLGRGGLELEVSLIESSSGRTLEEFSTSGSIVAGGVVGATMGIEDMVESAAAKVAERVARYGTGDLQAVAAPAAPSAMYAPEPLPAASGAAPFAAPPTYPSVPPQAGAPSPTAHAPAAGQANQRTAEVERLQAQVAERLRELENQRAEGRISEADYSTDRRQLLLYSAELEQGRSGQRQ